MVARGPRLTESQAGPRVEEDLPGLSDLPAKTLVERPAR